MSSAVMNSRRGTWLASEESLQTVIDVVPGVIGLDGNTDNHEESQYRRQANTGQIPSINTHGDNPSSVFSPTLNKRINNVSPEISQAPRSHDQR
jgi:hypothetical protein